MRTEFLRFDHKAAHSGNKKNINNKINILTRKDLKGADREKLVVSLIAKKRPAD